MQSLGGISSELYRGSLEHAKPIKHITVQIPSVSQHFVITYGSEVIRSPNFLVKMGKLFNFSVYCCMLYFGFFLISNTIYCLKVLEEAQKYPVWPHNSKINLCLSFEYIFAIKFQKK